MEYLVRLIISTQPGKSVLEIEVVVAVVVGDRVVVLVEDLEVDLVVVVLAEEEQADVGNTKNNKSILFLLRKSEIQWEII